MSLCIVIPTIERPTLDRAVESAYKQTVDTDFLIQVDTMEDGAAITRNKAIEHVTADWVGFCDDDDWLDIHYHEWLNEINKNADMVVFQMKRPDGMILPDHTDPQRLALNWVGISFALKTSIARQFPFRNMIAEDFDLIRRVQKAGLQVVVSPRVAYYLGSELTV